jgi:hypothetical protein
LQRLTVTNWVCENNLIAFDRPEGLQKALKPSGFSRTFNFKTGFYFFHNTPIVDPNYRKPIKPLYTQDRAYIPISALTIMHIPYVCILFFFAGVIHPYPSMTQQVNSKQQAIVQFLNLFVDATINNNRRH